jgi:3-dehydroquinate synthase
MRLEQAAQLIGARQAVIVSDENVTRLFGERFPPAARIVVEAGEGAKRLETAGAVYRRLAELEVDRATLLLGIGGGVVCDLAGFVAATYLRGLPCGLVATTLLAQVDAAIGGKNGVNLERFKNLVGTIRQPEFVICDLDLLQPLPLAEVQCGLAEIVKHALIADAALFERLERNAAPLLALDPQALADAVTSSVRIKTAVVGRDEQERGERRMLNFGHTLGHAIERVRGVSHGAAVSIGMRAAVELSVRKGWLPAPAAERIEGLLTRLGLPVRAEGEPAAIIEALRRDKKREGGRLHMVLLRRIGLAEVVSLPLAEVEAALAGG